jgi:hypothetical protein
VFKDMVARKMITPNVVPRFLAPGRIITIATPNRNYELKSYKFLLKFILSQ